MSYLKFDKRLMINLEQSLPKEMLRTNQSGAYHCTTIVGCNTRKQHGLLVIPIPEMDDKAHVLLSSLDETVIQHDAPFNLGLHQYGNNVYSPNGHKYIREFNCERVPVVTYRVGGVILTKEKIFISHQNRILIRYTLKEAHSPTTLQLRPFLAFRDANELCMENTTINKTIHHTEQGIYTCLYNGYPDLYMQLDANVKWVDNGHWYKGIQYYKDRNRGIPYSEDLWVPGYFEVEIKKGESIIFSASTFESNPKSFAATYDKELQIRTCRTSFYNCLKNSAKQFYLKNKDGMYIMAGYPWFNVRARDELIALPGCTLAIDHKQDFELIIQTFYEALRRNIYDGTTDRTIHEIDLPDIPLWLLLALHKYCEHQGKEQCRTLYGDMVKSLIEDIRKGAIRNLHPEPTGLLSTDGRNQPVTWLSASVHGKPIIPRSGLILEFNALWYNSLRFAIELFEDIEEEKKYIATLKALSEKTAENFRKTFLNGYGYLNDYVDGDYTDPEVRPNMAIAIGLPYSPLNRREQRKVLEFITRELLTPKGLRSLSPRSPAYRPIYKGDPLEREYAVHQGPARPWLFGFYARAYINVFGASGAGFIERQLIGYEDEMTAGCIGSLSEMYDANPPYRGRGAVSTAKNVGEILEAIHLVNQTLKAVDEQTEPVNAVNISRK